MHLLALQRDEPRELGPLRFSGGSRIVCYVALALLLCDSALGARNLGTQLGHPGLQSRELVTPRRHLTRGERDLNAEAAARQLGVALGALSLAGQRSHLALNFRNQVIEAHKIAGRLLEPALGGASPIAIQSDSCRLLEQLAAIVGPIGEQRVDHPGFDHDARVGAQPRAAEHVRDVAQATRRAVQEVVALARARETSRDDDFAKRDWQLAAVVLEVQRDFRDVHRAPRRRTLEDHFFHFLAAEQAGALLAKHPAHGVRHVRLTAPVRTHDRGDALIERHHRGIGERLEPVQLELGQSH